MPAFRTDRVQVARSHPVALAVTASRGLVAMLVNGAYRQSAERRVNTVTG
jgi:hypothetical protein